MYIPETREELYAELAIYVGYAPDLTKYEHFSTQEEAEVELYQAIDNVFKEPETYAQMRQAAEAAFLACRESRVNDALDNFKIIIDELSRAPTRSN